MSTTTRSAAYLAGRAAADRHAPMSAVLGAWALEHRSPDAYATAVALHGAWKRGGLVDAIDAASAIDGGDVLADVYDLLRSLR